MSARTGERAGKSLTDPGSTCDTVPRDVPDEGNSETETCAFFWLSVTATVFASHSNDASYRAAAGALASSTCPSHRLHVLASPVRLATVRLAAPTVQLNATAVPLPLGRDA